MGSMDAPATRGYLQEMQSAIDAQSGIQGRLIGLEKQYTPEWQAVQKQALLGGMGNLASIYAGTSAQSEALQQQMLRSQGGIYSELGGVARNAYNATLDPTTAGLYSTMASQAAQGLASGRNLNYQETRLAQGSARAAMAARGMQFGNQAIAAEVLNSYNLEQAREDRARQFAGQVYGVGQSNAQQAMTMYGVPLMTQLNQLSTPSLLNQSSALYGQIGAKLFQPESQYNAQLISANQQNEMQTKIANQQAKAGMISAGIGAIGMAAGGFLGNAGLFKGAAGATGAAGGAAGGATSFNSFMAGSSLNGLSSPTFSSNPSMFGVKY